MDTLLDNEERMKTQAARLGKVVCWDISENAEHRLPERASSDPELVCASEPELIFTELGKPGEAILLLTELPPEAMEVVRTFREMEEWATLPIIATILSREVTSELRHCAEELSIRLLEFPQAMSKFWSEVRKACLQYRGKRDQTRANLQMRKYYRVSFSVPAICQVESKTVDLSAGGVNFHSNYPYRPGETGSIDIPSLRDTLGVALPFQVVRSETLRDGPFQFSVRARFIGLEEDVICRLIKAMQVLEPNASESGEQEVVLDE